MYSGIGYKSKLSLDFILSVSYAYEKLTYVPFPFLLSSSFSSLPPVGVLPFPYVGVLPFLFSFTRSHAKTALTSCNAHLLASQPLL